MRGPDDCWEWKGRRNKCGYGEIEIGTTPFGVHRIVAAIFLGPHPDWVEVVMHTCDNPPCCNPAHLVYATQADNLEDARRKGRVVYAFGLNNGNSKLTEDQVKQIKESSEKQSILAARYNVTQPYISQIKSQKARNK